MRDPHSFDNAVDPALEVPRMYATFTLNFMEMYADLVASIAGRRDDTLDKLTKWWTDKLSEGDELPVIKAGTTFMSTRPRRDEEDEGERG